jgi:hypothetical protein
MTPTTRRSLHLVLCGTALALAAACSISPPLVQKEDVPRQFPLRDFFSNPERAYFRLSDDGRTLGFMQPVAVDGGKRRLNVFVQALEGSRPVGDTRKLTSETARDISIYYWKGSDTILYEKDFGGDENFHVVAVDVKTGRITDLTPGDKVRASIQDDLPEDADHILVSHNRRNAEVFDVYRVDLRTGREELVAQNPGDIVGWQTDHAGRVRVAVRSQGLDTITLYRPNESSEFKAIIATDYKTEVDPAFFTADDSKLYMISNRGRDKKALVMVDPARPDDLVAWNDRQLRIRQFPIDDMQVRAADPAGGGLDPNLVGARQTVWKLSPFEWSPEFARDLRLHAALRSPMRRRCWRSMRRAQR